jgi:hypothetical protein
VAGINMEAFDHASMFFVRRVDTCTPWRHPFGARTGVRVICLANHAGVGKPPIQIMSGYKPDLLFPVVLRRKLARFDHAPARSSQVKDF